jgi:PKD repeat protein
MAATCRGPFVTLDLRRLSAGRARPGEPAAPRARQRGQSLVEFALILPLLLLLVVVALDFGRIYLGYINVQNMARIAANEAANNPLAWSVTPDTAIQTRYRNKVLEDASATNCNLPVNGSGQPIVPSPSFSDRTGDGISTGLGDEVTVTLTCSFSVVTPMISSILGNQVQVTAQSDFPVKAGMTAVAPAGGGGGGGSTNPPTSAFIANSTVTASAGSPGTLSTVGPTVIVDFRDSSSGVPNAWSWDFGDGVTSTARDVAHQYSCTAPDAFGYCSYLVTMRASNLYGTGAPAYMTVQVLAQTTANFTADRQVIERGQSVTFTDASTAGGTNYTWVFGDGTPNASGPAKQVSHAYATAGSFTVSLTVTYPSPAPAASVTKTAFITVNAGYCDVPSLTRVNFDDATAIWQGSPYNFSGTVKRAAGAPPGNFSIKAQSIVAGGTAPCNSDIYVSTP